MKYTININQKAVRDNNWNLKANHMAILQVVCEWVVNPKCLKIQDDKGTWFWVSHRFIIDELPMFDVKERRCLDLIKNLESCQLLELNPNNKQLGRTFMRVGLNYEKLNSDYAEKCDPTQKIAKPIAINCVPPTQKIADYNSTNYNNTNYNSSLPEEKKDEGFDLAGKERAEKALTAHELTSLTLEQTKEKFLTDNGLFEAFVKATKLEKKNFDKAVEMFIAHTVKSLMIYPRSYEKGDNDSKSHFKNWFRIKNLKEFEISEPVPEKKSVSKMNKEEFEAYKIAENLEQERDFAQNAIDRITMAKMAADKQKRELEAIGKPPTVYPWMQMISNLPVK